MLNSHKIKEIHDSESFTGNADQSHKRRSEIAGHSEDHKKVSQRRKAVTDAYVLNDNAQQKLSVLRKESGRPSTPYESQGVCEMQSDGHECLDGDESQRNMREAKDLKNLPRNSSSRLSIH